MSSTHTKYPCTKNLTEMIAKIERHFVSGLEIKYKPYGVTLKKRYTTIHLTSSENIKERITNVCQSMKREILLSGQQSFIKRINGGGGGGEETCDLTREVVADEKGLVAGTVEIFGDADMK